MLRKPSLIVGEKGRRVEKESENGEREGEKSSAIIIHRAYMGFQVRKLLSTTL